MPSQAAPPTSVLAQLRASRARLQEERHLDVEVPGYGDLLHIRCQPVAWEVLRGIRLKAEKSKAPRAELLSMADTIIHATAAVLYRGEDGELVELEDVKWDRSLSDLLELALPPAATAREVLFATFPDDLAVTALFVEITEWQASGDVETDEELGKSPEPTGSWNSPPSPEPSESE